MTEKEIENLAELIAIKTAEKYLEITKEHVETQIKLHEAQCTAKKYTTGRNFISAIVGGAIVAVINWILKK